MVPFNLASFFLSGPQVLYLSCITGSHGKESAGNFQGDFYLKSIDKVRAIWYHLPVGPGVIPASGRGLSLKSSWTTFRFLTVSEGVSHGPEHPSPGPVRAGRGTFCI
jgi:hypothetical protein